VPDLETVNVAVPGLSTRSRIRMSAGVNEELWPSEPSRVKQKLRKGNRLAAIVLATVRIVVPRYTQSRGVSHAAVYQSKLQRCDGDRRELSDNSSLA